MTLVLRLLLLLLAIWLLGKVLRSSAQKLRPATSTLPPLAERIDAILPQTQCGQCGHAGCLPYAQALARGEDSINRCRRAARTAYASWPPCCIPTTCPSPPMPRRKSPRRGTDRRSHLYRLYPVHPGLSGRCHSGFGQTNAYRAGR
ncbi:(Fe-S)-binding protein [Aquitalea magnusonii]|uniref:(Fe-S)-binding protein n=1 Tax=Aquitalea magnusonii TaxID=332411 RepID=UPI0030B82E11